jgi:hypothetical protein
MAEDQEPAFRAAALGGLAGMGLVAAGRAVGAMQVGHAAKGVLRDGEAVGQEDEAEEGGERCEAFHGQSTMVLLRSPKCAGAHGRNEAAFAHRANSVLIGTNEPVAC